MGIRELPLLKRCTVSPVDDNLHTRTDPLFIGIVPGSQTKFSRIFFLPLFSVIFDGLPLPNGCKIRYVHGDPEEWTRPVEDCE
jgi:hypothetical protein